MTKDKLNKLIGIAIGLGSMAVAIKLICAIGEIVGAAS